MTRTHRMGIVTCGALILVSITLAPAQDTRDVLGEPAYRSSTVDNSSLGAPLLSAAGMSPGASRTLSLLPSLSLGDPGDGGGTYMAVKVGPLWFVDDLEDLDTGVNVEIVFGQKVVGPLSVELGTGLFWNEDDDGSEDIELWGFPLTANLRLTIPVLVFEIYGGGGIGGYYVDTELRSLFRETDQDLVFGGNLFLGVQLHLWKLTAGVEGKYISTMDASLFDTDVSLEAFALMVSVGVSF